jgi:NAD(P)H-quinone oxidoreductase subunit 5
MPDSYVWFIAVGPLMLGAVSVVPGGSTAARNRFAVVAAAVALAVAIAGAALVVRHGTLRTPTLGADGIGLSLYLDSLSATMFTLVAFIGLIVVGYTQRYLEGDRHAQRFMRSLCLTLASVLFLAAAGNMFAFTVAWVATSLSLHQLLVFYPDRPAALLAARKKFIASRLGDLCLLGAVLIVYRLFGSLDYAVLFERAGALRATGGGSLAFDAVALFLVATALLKSAQFPLHGWLIEVMETPTPVSALLHAGIINAGGFLILRFAGLIALSLPSLDTLAIVGGLTALFGSVVMLTQTSIKVTLAYSTIAQMGFMMLECGLGAFATAMLHLLAHSLYKAHAFLASGSVIDIARASWTPSPGGRPHPARLFFAILSVVLVTFAVSRFWGAPATENHGIFVFAAVLLLGLIHLVANGIDQRPSAYVVGRTVLLAGVVAVSYFALQVGIDTVVGDSLPRTPVPHGPFEYGIAVLVVASFALVTFLQGLVPYHAARPRWQSLYAHVSNGFYVNTVANRFVLRYWPLRPSADVRASAAAEG